MSLLSTYLSKSSTQRVLSRKPGEKGFSLIELVVVVAVLAILAAVAIPTFTALTDDARLNTSKQILTDAYKECQYNKTRTGTASRENGLVDEMPSGVTWNAAAEGTDCDEVATATVSTTCNIGLDLSDGDTQMGGADAAWPKTYGDCS